jgi:hypothetical protein
MAHVDDLQAALKEWAHWKKLYDYSVIDERTTLHALDVATETYQDAIKAKDTFREKLEGAAATLMDYIQHGDFDDPLRRPTFIPSPTISPTGTGVLGSPSDVPASSFPAFGHTVIGKDADTLDLQQEPCLLKRVHNGEQIPFHDAVWWDPVHGTLEQLRG